MKRTFLRAPILVAVMIVAAGILVSASDPAGPSAVLQRPNERKPAAAFVLENASGKAVQLHDYRGKIVLLDFWATWCHGCQEEIPWFAEFQRRYAGRDFAVVGVSLDDGGWKAVTPFVKSTSIPYEILLGNEKTAKDYGILSMPDTFLIDREGRIAAGYAGVVDKDNVEKNIQSLLKQN